MKLAVIAILVMSCGSAQKPAPRVPAHQSPCVPKVIARLRGCVRDKWTGAGMSGVSVVVRASNGRQLAALRTDAAGEWGADIDPRSISVTVYYGDASLKREIDTLKGPLGIVIDPHPPLGEIN